MNKRIQSHKLFICERHFTVDQIYVYSSRKSLKEGALPTLNLPRPSTNANATNNQSKRAIEKREEYALSQEQMPQLPPPKAYISFEEFKQRIKNLALNKLWNITIQEELVTASFTSSNYVLPTYEIFINSILYFTLCVYSWILPKDHELYLSCNSSFSNVTLSKFIERLTSQYMLCKGITLPDARKEIIFVKHVIPTTFNYFVFQNSDLQQSLHQDEYFRSTSCKLLVLPSENIYKNCHAENIKFKSQVNFKNAVLTAAAKLNAPVKFTSPDRIKLTLQ